MTKLTNSASTTISSIMINSDSYPDDEQEIVVEASWYMVKGAQKRSFISNRRSSNSQMIRPYSHGELSQHQGQHGTGFSQSPQSSSHIAVDMLDENRFGRTHSK
jgi:hypothetical protein